MAEVTGRAPIVLALVGAALLAGCGSDDEGEPPGKLEKELIPAEIVSSPKSYFASESLKPVENAWRTSDRSRFTQVEAGAANGEESVGAMAIFRHHFRNAGQSASLVKVLGAGALKITKAPEGKEVQSSAQRNGRIEFTSENGVSGTLRLKNDSISLHAP